jgi:NAD(P)-dependent dehydrogenase (short-subunit alcohol dehydrogenase family)
LVEVERMGKLEGKTVVVTGGGTRGIGRATAAEHGAPAFGAYSASKAAVRSFARTWANELKDRGIRVNAISPGPIDTSGITELVGEQNAAAFKAKQGAAVAMGRMGHPEEVAAAVVFLASADSSYIIGTNLYVDGGENQI